MELGLYQQQSMKLVMTNELRQAISLLQYSSMELAEYIQEKSLENPLIELSDSFDHSFSYKQKSNSDDNPIDYIGNDRPSLYDIVFEQTRFLELTELDFSILRYLIHSLDKNGYLLEGLEYVAEYFHVPLHQVEYVLKVLQGVEPAGIGARNLKECLLLQIERKYPEQPLASLIIRDNLEDIASRSLRQIADQYNVSVKAIQEIEDLLKTLDPKPGAAFSVETPTYIIPDIILENTNKGFQIRLNEELFPKLSMNKEYFHLAKQFKGKAEGTYFDKLSQEFQWLQKSIEQRGQTLMKVMSVILDKQFAFFSSEGNQMKPLTLKEVAEKANIHESTVSRAVNGKYAQTPKGVFELKSFFPSGIKSSNGEDHASADVVKDIIRAMVNEEDKAKPLSDQKIAAMLKSEHQLQVSRRTVAKYREQLNISSSMKRKRYG